MILFRQHGSPITPVVLALMLAVGVTGCGSTSTTSSRSRPVARAAPTARGDISDTATYLTFRGHGFSVKYVEGWGIKLGPGIGVTMSDKDSAETVAITTGSQTISRYASADLSRLSRSLPRYHLVSRSSVRLAAGNSIHVQYRALSSQDPVTGKRVPVIVDRYYVSGSGKRAIVTLQTPVGVDNVDAFRLIAHSFRWR